MCKVCEDIYVYLQYLNEVHYEMLCLMKLWALHINNCLEMCLSSIKTKYYISDGWKRLTLKSISPTIISK